MPRTFRHRGGALALLLATLAAAGCRDALSANNPKLIDESELNDKALVNVMMSTAVGEFQSNYSEFAWNSAILSDEALNATNDYRSGELNQRIVELAQGNVGPYPLLQRTRATADTMVGRIRGLVASPATDLRLARALAYDGYSYVLLAEFMCESPINDGPMLQDDSLEVLGINRFKEAIAIATAGRGTGAQALTADSIANLARVGAARASLQINRKADAISYASAVPSGFRFWVDYITSANTRLENTLWPRVNGQNKQLGVHPIFQALHDPRIPYNPKAVLGHNQLTLLNIPYSPSSFNTWVPGSNAPIQPYSQIELASGLEARYIAAEASGPTAATLSLVNERRAVGGQPAVAVGGDSLMAELRDQKRRDFYLAARRLGDLRRYKAQGVGDFFPTGPHPTKEWGLYGTATCFIITQDEVNSNPNVHDYNPPSTRPSGYSP